MDIYFMQLRRSFEFFLSKVYRTESNFTCKRLFLSFVLWRNLVIIIRIGAAFLSTMYPWYIGISDTHNVYSCFPLDLSSVDIFLRRCTFSSARNLPDESTSYVLVSNASCG